MQPRTLRYVILGAGGIANAHVNGYSGQADVTPVGFQDVVDGPLERWKKRFPDAEVDTDAARLLARTKPDLVSVCSPNVAHKPLTLAALDAGCHVLCEKPMAMTLDEAQAMEAARGKAGRLGAINFTYRNVAAFRFAREVIRGGELGAVQRLNVRYLQSFLGADTTLYSWRNDVAIAGFGALGDLGVHMIDGAAFVTGLRPRRLVGLAQALVREKRDAKGVARPVTTDSNASFLIEYDSGAVGTFETGQAIPGYGNNFHIEVSGDRGVLRISSEEADALTLLAGKTLAAYGTWSRENFPKVTIPTDFANRQPKSTIESFVRAIRGEDVEYATFADGVAAQQCLTALTESMRTRAWVDVTE